jgi:hypothetical protein
VTQYLGLGIVWMAMSQAKDVIMNRGGKNGWIFGRKTKELNIEYCPFEFYGLQFKYSIFNRKYSI